MFLEELAVKSGLASAMPVTADVLQQVNTLPNRLRWILECTMDSVGDFEHRRKVAAICGCHPCVVSRSLATGACAIGEERCIGCDRR
jgi:hypothetical protein